MVHQPGHVEPVAPMGFEDVAAMPLPGGGVPEQDILGDFYGGGQPGGPGGVPYAPGQAPDPYHDGDEFAIFRALAPEEQVRLQQQLVAVGLASKVTYGEFDGTETAGTRGALRSLLGMANFRGEDWTQTLGRIATNPAIQEEAKEFEPTPYIRPNFASISQKVKQTFRDELGRDPDKYEMQQLAGELTGFYELEHEAGVEFDRIVHEQQTTPGVQDPGSVTRGDPLAQFQELFESKYANELDFVQDKAEARVAGDAVDSAVGLASRAARGAV